MTRHEANRKLMAAAYFGRVDELREAITAGADVEYVQPDTGMNALHTAIGRSQIAAVKYLLEEAGAVIAQDRFGRWPTLTAAQCEVSEELCDYIVEKEAEALGIEIPSGEEHGEQAG